MSIRLIRLAAAAEATDELHEARLLLLLNAAAERGDGSINGITKLAKMDFLVRYPVYLKRVAEKLRRRPLEFSIQPYEFDTVESAMIRFRYGPWDTRYRRWIGTLVAQGLATAYVSGRTVHVRASESGKTKAQELLNDAHFADLGKRTAIVNQLVGDFGGTKLKDFVYEIVPEITGMDWGEEIRP